MTGLSVLLLLVGLWVLKELIVALVTWKKTRSVTQKRRVEVTQRHFAEARNALMRAALDGEIDVDSYIFKLFYFLNTAFMRRPDQYVDISDALAKVLILDDSDAEISSEVKKEASTLSQEAAEAIKKTGDAMGYLVIDYSFLLRNAFRIVKNSRPGLSRWRMMKELAESAGPSKKSEMEEKVERAQKNIYDLVPTSSLSDKTKWKHPPHPAV
jgi:hypothetical protein